VLSFRLRAVRVGLFGIAATAACNADPDAAALSFGDAPSASANASGVSVGDDPTDDGDGPTDDGTGGGGGDGTGDGLDDDDSPDDDSPTGDDTDPDDADPDDGPVDTGDGGSCQQGDTQSCYTGPANTENIGECGSGVATCSSNGEWLACEGESLPGTETCNGLDDDCNGTPDDGNPDEGGNCATGLFGPCANGLTVCSGGDVECEPTTPAAASETCGNGVDDDCNGTVDDGCTCDPLNPAPGCGVGMQCVPQANNTTQCNGAGNGTQYSACLSAADCGPLFACVQTTVDNAWCMQWCFSDAQCGLFDFCTSLAPPVFANDQEYGVCWDGFP